jgi:hypothetical protein
MAVHVCRTMPVEDEERRSQSHRNSDGSLIGYPGLGGMKCQEGVSSAAALLR